MVPVVCVPIDATLLCGASGSHPEVSLSVVGAIHFGNVQPRGADCFSLALNHWFSCTGRRSRYQILGVQFY